MLPVVMWFRRDLRVADNPALCAAVASGAPVLPLYILDDADAGEWKFGSASRWWLHHSLDSLNASLGGGLCVRAGSAVSVFAGLGDIGAVYCNSCYEPWRCDDAVAAYLSGRGVKLFSFNGSLLFDDVVKADGSPYKVFTPFYKNGCLAAPPPRRPVTAPSGFAMHDAGSDTVNLMPSVPWYKQMESLWEPGEEGATARLADFIAGGLSGYIRERDYPSLAGTSRLSPHLAFGELSPNQVWYAAVDCSGAAGFLRQLCWREFAYSLLRHFPELPHSNMNSRFDAFAWRSDAESLRLWQRGETGYPIVDAGMRELWQTGYMHNRVRMIVGSFLVKNLLLHWHHGESWFRDTLLDADLANNCMGWQWVAGSGADAAPYFRVFNPVLQGKKFDGAGAYVRKYVPELAALSDRYIHCPWESGQKLDYPPPMVDLRASRDRALAAFRSLPG